MATQSQIDANRRNAQKSTGPKTPVEAAIFNLGLAVDKAPEPLL